MKTKVFCMISVLLCFISSGAFGGEHFGIQGLFYGNNENIPFSGDLYEQDGDVTIVSSLIPETVLSLNSGENRIVDCISELFSLSPDQMISCIHTADSVFSSWIQQQNQEARTSVFTGDIFDHARSAASSSFLLTDFLRYVENSLLKYENAEKGKDKKRYSFLLSAMSAFQSVYPQDKLIIRFRTFDEGKYYSLSVLKRHETLLTITVDNTLSDMRHMIIGHRENGRYYFRDLRISAEPSGFTFISGLYSGLNSSYRMLTAGNLLYTERYSLMKGDGTDNSFLYSAEAPSVSETFTVSGNISADEIKMSIYLTDTGKNVCDISVYRDEIKNKVSFSDKKIMYSDRVEDRTEIQLDFLSGLMEFALSIVPELPVSYQEILISLISDL